jgi:hypothetical protein
MYEALYQTIIKVEIFTGEMKFSIWYQHKKNKIFPLNLHWTGFVFFTSAAITWVQMREMSKAGLTDWMVYQRHVFRSYVRIMLLRVDTAL